ncbi:mannosyl-oligosaccharide 1,2-alpha-mannosidase IA [Planococcus citri]|uniref:mannosyl-oligosaccharide 1,2-alpha-mannosidase IA n=1 Tax=Planococcus citri TaxID=170843 RepID=UPI0031F8B8EF
MPAQSLLSMHNRYLNGVPLPSGRKPFRSKERYLIIIVFCTLVLMFCGTFFYLPELRPSYGARESVYKVYKHVQEAGPDLLIPAPPFAEEVKGNRNLNRHYNSHNEVDPHVLEDRQKLQAKIVEEEQRNQKVLERPDIAVINKVPSSSLSVNPGPQPQTGDQSVGTIPPAKNQHYPVVVGGEDKDEDIRQKRNKVVEMMKHAWGNYAKYAWGMNELKPLSKKAHNNSVFGAAPLGATIVDGLDTLYIMGLHDEFKRGRDWVAENLNFDNINQDLSVFEINIRFVGGLLSCYALTGDVLFRDKAEQVANKLLPAFQTPTGIPYSLVNFKTGYIKNYGWASGSSSILSEFGTLHLEFSYLSDVTGNNIFKEKVERIRKVLKDTEKVKGLYPNYMNPKTGKWGQHHMSMGGLGDSFYEYLLKSWIQSGKEDEDAKEMFEDAMDAVLKHMLQTSPGGLMYISDLKYDKLEHKMDALACFSGGLFALGSHTLQDAMSKDYLKTAEGITNTCHEAYNRSYVKLAPESFRFIESAEAKAVKSNEKYYILRPETVESYFTLWRITKDPKYRKWGWEVVEALETYCKVDGGYSGIRNVYHAVPVKDDVQQSYFVAEMLKYLYLLFSDDSLISLDEWVFNSEAHPLPIKGHNAYYRPKIESS